MIAYLNAVGIMDIRKRTAFEMVVILILSYMSIYR
jgi:hypothetical protein